MEDLQDCFWKRRELNNGHSMLLSLDSELVKETARKLIGE